MLSTYVPWYVPCRNTGLSKPGDPVFPHFCPLNQNLPVLGQGGGGVQQIPNGFLFDTVLCFFPVMSTGLTDTSMEEQDGCLGCIEFRFVAIFVFCALEQKEWCQMHRRRVIKKKVIWLSPRVKFTSMDNLASPNSD